MFCYSDVQKHNTASDCWLAVQGSVYDVTAFLDAHPGGRRALLAFAGKDATEAFHRHHTKEILATHGSAMRIGKLSGHKDDESPHVPYGASGLDSPFPHARFEGTGFEAVRFQWANLEALTRKPNASSLKSGAVFQQKNNLAPLNESDWLHVHGTDKYAHEMIWRYILLTQHAEEVCTPVACDISAGGDEIVEAEAEALQMICDWLKLYTPDRFQFSEDEVKTLTTGYEHTFRFNDFKHCPLRLAALLVQEDLVLMREEDVKEGGIKEFDRASQMLQQVDHPSGKRHVLVSGVSCFSTNVVKRHMLPMSGIHHPAVPGFHAHLQHSMNHFLTQLSQDGFYRHNYMFQDFDSVLLLDHPWARHVCIAELSEQTHHQAADRSARFRASKNEGFFKNIRTKEDVRQHLRLRCEYQTLRRLSKHTNFIIFTIKNYVDPMSKLELQPSAALALSAAIRLRPKGICYYQSMGLEKAQRALLGYLDDVVAKAGIRPWHDVVPEPWQRVVEDDGTFAYHAEQTAFAELAKQRRKSALRVASMTLTAVVASHLFLTWVRGRRSQNT